MQTFSSNLQCLVMTALLFFSIDIYALPFTIVPKSGTSLPTTLIAGQTTNAYYTITNNTSSLRSGNFIKYLPPNVTQVTSNPSITNLCGTTFTLQRANTSGDSCTLELLISGAVNGNDPDPKHHLFACFPGGLTCTGTPNPLNVDVVAGNSEFVAGGLYQDTLGNNFVGFAISTNSGASWRKLSLASPAGFSNGFASDVSCTGNTCLATTIFNNDATGHTTIVIAKSTNQGASWSYKVITPPSGFDDGRATGIYCRDAFCLAVGTYTNTVSGLNQAVILTTNNTGNTWSNTILATPAGMLEALLISVDCTGNTCVSVGAYSAQGAAVPAIVTSVNGGNSWTQQALPLLGGYADAILTGVACNGTSCIAVGDYIDNSGNDNLGVAISTDNGSTWSQKILTPPSGFTVALFKGISCTSNYCVAVGNYSYGIAYSGYPAIAVTTNNGATWSQQTLPIPTGYVYGYLNGVNCTSNVCVAAGYYQVGSDNTPFIAVSTNNGRTWTQQVLAPPSPMVAGEFNGVG